jgi:hypothetical protein
MRDYVRLNLMMLASIEYQRRYVVNGTRDAYRLPEEIYFDAVEGAEHEVEGDPGKPPTNLDERDTLQEFLRTVDPIPNDYFMKVGSAEELIERDPLWARARNAAIACLSKLGLSIPPRDWKGA